MGFLSNLLFGKNKNNSNKTKEDISKDKTSIIPSEEDVDELEMFDDIFDD